MSGWHHCSGKVPKIAGEINRQGQIHEVIGWNLFGVTPEDLQRQK